MKKLRVGVLFGGRSGEHEVSLLSAKEVLAAIDPTKYEVVPIAVSKTGAWLLCEPDTLHQLEHHSSTVTLLPEPIHQALMSMNKDATTVAFNKPLDVIFPLIHGTYGEDGCVQGLLELANIPYVGAGVLGSAVGMDKITMKMIFQTGGLPITPYTWVWRSQWESNPDLIKKEIESKLTYPLFVKPANLGSSVGISKVKTPDELSQAMDIAASFDRKIIIEQGIEDAREFEVALLGNEDPLASTAGEIIPANEFYDYAAKYLDDRSTTKIPAEASQAVIKQLQDYAIAAFKLVGCEGLARVDFLVRKSDMAIFVSEINTLPGFTQISMYPKLWAEKGISYPQLIDTLIELALKRHQDRLRNKTSFT